MAHPEQKIVAMRPDTGEYVWHYQETPGETWDFTATQPINLATLNIGGKQRRVLMQAPKNGLFYVLDRQTLQVLTSFGDGSRQPGGWYAVHSIASDSKGNLYTTETYEGKRVQKFVSKGIGPVTRAHQGVLWPRK